MGKTTQFLIPLSKQYRAEFFNKNETYQNFHHATQAVMIDEYTQATLRATQVNEMCDGTYKYPNKYGGPTRLNGPIVLICANASIDSVYPNAG